MWGVLLAAIVGVGRPLALSMGRRLAPSFEPGSRRRWLWGGVWPSVLEGSGHFMSSEWRCLSGERRSAPVLGGRRPPMMAGWRCLASWLRLPQALVVRRLLPGLGGGRFGGGGGEAAYRCWWHFHRRRRAAAGCGGVRRPLLTVCWRHRRRRWRVWARWPSLATGCSCCCLSGWAVCIVGMFRRGAPASSAALA